MTDHYLAWWNVENLFDTSTSADRPEYLQKELKGELKGWTSAILEKKVKQLASIIMQMNDGKGPDLLGVCEVENAAVLDRLVAALAPLQRDYAVAHHDTSDQRGIDIAFVYDRARFTAEEQFHYVVLKRTATRDLFQVNFRTMGGNVISVIGNHWPARMVDPAYRIIAAETLSYWIQRIHEIVGGEPCVVAMGDFNDEPFSRSLADFALSTESSTKVLRARNYRLFNLMWPLVGQGITSYVYSGTPNMLDQFLVTKGMLRKDAPLYPVRPSVRVLRYPEMVTGLYKGPRRFGRPSSKLDVEGFSDHFPIALTVREPE